MSWILDKDKKYRVTVKLNFLESLAGNEMISSKFLQNGFSDVQVSGDGQTRIMEGTWPKGWTEFTDSHVANVEEIDG